MHSWVVHVLKKRRRQVDSKGGYVRVVVRWDTFQVWLWGSHCLSRWQVCSAILVPARLRYCLCLIARALLLRGTRDRRDFAVAMWKKVPKITSLARSWHTPLAAVSSLFFRAFDLTWPQVIDIHGSGGCATESAQHVARLEHARQVHVRDDAHGAVERSSELLLP